jgi:hypothetical protein
MFAVSLRRLIASLSRTYLGVGRPAPRRPRRGFRPEIEFLEGRLTPSTTTWTGADYQNSTAWSDANNWSGGVPTANSVVVFTSNSSVKSSTSTIDQAYTVAGIQIDPLWGGTINGNGNLTLASGSANEWDSGSINPAVGVSITNNGTLTLNGSGDVIFGGNGTLVNNGTINQTGAGNLQLAGSGNKAVTLDNTATGVYNFQTDSGIDNGYSAGGTIINAGLIEKTHGTGTSHIAPAGFPAAMLTNTGTIDAASGTLSLQTSTNDTNGTFTAAAGATLNLTDFADFFDSFVFTENGTFTASGAGTIALPGGALADGPSGATFNIPSSIAFQDSGGAISVPANTTLTYNGLLTLTNASGTNVNLQGGGTFLLPSGSTIDQAGAGNLNLEPPSSGGSVTPTLQIASGATYNFQNTSSISDYGGGTVLNQGLIETTDTLAASPGTSQLALNLTNNGGTLDAAAGTLQVNDPSTNTNGTYTAAAGATLDLTGTNRYNTFTETGTFGATGAGTITIGAGTLGFNGSASTLSLPSTLAFQWTGDTISVPTNDTLTVNGNLTLNGTSNEYLSGGGTVTENGTITQSSSGSLLVSGNSTGTVATTLVIPHGSVYNFAANSGIANNGYGGGVVTNSGTIAKTAGGASSFLNVAFNNTGGTLSVTNGTLTLDTTGGESTGGTLSVSSGAILDLTGGNTVSYSGTYIGSGSGEVLLDAGTLNTTGGTNGATFNLPGNLFVWSGGAINTAAGNNFTILGNMRITGNGSESINGTGEVNIGTATAAGTLNDTATANTLTINSGASLGINARGTLNIADDTINGGGLLLDQGSLVKTAGTGGATISTTVDSQGKVTVNNGTLLFSGAVDQVFNGVLTGGTWTATSSATTASTLDISSASFNTIGVSASVILSGPHSSFSNLSGLSANQGTFNLLSAASFATAGNFTNSGSMTLSPGSVLTVNGAFTQSGTLTVQMGGTASSPTLGSVVSTGPVTLGGTLTVTSTVVPPVNLNVGYEILNNESGSPISGTFAGLPEGATFSVKVGATTMTFKITYKGGSTGNSVFITRIS